MQPENETEAMFTLVEKTVNKYDADCFAMQTMRQGQSLTKPD